jgi:hypothetical protein
MLGKGLKALETSCCRRVGGTTSSLLLMYGQRQRATDRGAVGLMPVVACCEHVSYPSLRTLERQSLCESHRQRRWLTHWS